ncbi:hypothetical protein BJX68DRAFT_72491 [Aspergillus pseudodeflectus]|uniref:Uncharacterized protein n=1 Tax=Aspergillus pseudodeflectus TaxID=176178 RepID=A0ABR4KEU0_9EURO
MLRRVLDLVLTTLAIQSVAQAPCVAAASRHPRAPKLSYLYTAFVHCKGTLMNEDSPRGTRLAIPIVGGNFTGPRLSGMHEVNVAECSNCGGDNAKHGLSGKILDVGADWGIVDPKTGIFSADTRYNLRTDDGADIFIQTSGPASPSGQLHLRLLFETGHEDYYWLNNIVGKIVFLSKLPLGFVTCGSEMRLII